MEVILLAIDYAANLKRYLEKGDMGAANFAARKLGQELPFQEYDQKRQELSAAKKNLQPGQSVLNAYRAVGIGPGQSLQDVAREAMNAPKQAAPQQPAYQMPNFSSQIGSKYSSLISSNLAKLKAAYDKSRSDINAQIPGIQQDAVRARNMNDADYYTNALPELYKAMEATGQRGGENITGRIAASTVRGQNLGGINQTEMNNLAALQKAIADLNAEQPLKEQEVEQQLLSEQAQAEIEAQKYGLDYGLRLADLTGNIETSPGVTMPTLAAQQFLANKAMNEAGLTGYYNGQQTLQGQQVQSAQKQQELDNLYRQQVFDYNASRDTVSDTQWQQSMNLNLRQQSFQEAQQKIENALAQKRISQEDASQALQWAKFNAESDPNSIDNKLKSAQTNQLNAETSNLNAGLTKSGGTQGGEPSQSEVVNYWTSSVMSQLDKLADVNTQKQWLKEHKNEIVSNAGLDTFNAIKAEYGIYSLD